MSALSRYSTAERKSMREYAKETASMSKSGPTETGAAHICKHDGWDRRRCARRQICVYVSVIDPQLMRFVRATDSLFSRW